jgi:hypothetical protein
MANSVNLTIDQRMALMSMESKAKQKTSLDVFNEFLEMGFSNEVITGLKEISLRTATDISGKVIEVGKIIVIKIIDFIKENSGIAIGIALGAALGALTAFIPFIGPIIAPFMTKLGAIAGGLIGNKIQNAPKNNGLTGEIENIKEVSVKFFNLLKDIFKAIFKPEALK